MQSRCSPPTSSLNQSQPRLRGELRFLPQRDRDGQPWYRVEHDQAPRFYRLGIGEFELLARLDGHTSVDAARAAAAAAAPSRALTATQAESLVLWAEQQGLLSGDSSGRSASDRTAPPQAIGGRRSSLLWIRIPLGRGGENLDRLTGWLGWLFTPAAALLAMVLGLAALVLVFSQLERFLGDASALMSVSGSVALLVAWGILKTVHEVGHAVSCRKFGGRVGQFGVAWMLVAPAAYVDLTDAYRIRSPWRRAVTAIAGVYLELVLASLAGLLWSQTDSPVWCHLLTSVAVMASVSSIVFNLNPLMRLDGYFVLTDLLGRPNLAGDAAAEVASVAGWLFLGRATQRSGAGRRARWGLLTFGVASAAYRVVVIGGLLLAAVAMYGRVGLAIGAAAAVAVLVPSLRRVTTAVFGAVSERPAVALRLTAVASLVAVAAAAGQRWAWTGQDAWPGVVEFAEVAPVRSGADGFVTAVLVQDGQRVAAGDPLLTLENAALVAQCSEAAAALASAELQDRLYRQQHDMAAMATQRQATEALRSRFEQLQRRRAALRIVAPRSGTVVAPDIANWQGRWLVTGDAVCHVADRRQLKAIVAVPPEWLPRLAALAGTTVSVRRGQDWLSGRITTAPGHTSTTPPHPALATNGGGPLPTQSAGTSSPAVLLQPHARVEVWLQPAAVLPEPKAAGRGRDSAGAGPPLRAGEPVWVYPQ